MSRSSGWICNLFQGGHPPTQSAQQLNERIAKYWVSKALLARWVMFDTFIDVAKTIKEGVLDDNVRRDWLIFQTLHLILYNDMDPFLALMNTCFRGVSDEVLQSLHTLYSPSTVLGSAFNSTTDSFFYVLDEAHVAARQYTRAFADTGGSVPRPVLRPIINYLSSSNSVNVIVSGTGFSHELFETALASGVDKGSLGWDVVHATGDFSNQDIQLAYISRYLTPSFLHSPSGTHLKTRMYGWLRGRYVVNKTRAIAHVYCSGIRLLPATWRN
jgi:hypothetical protein